MFAAGKVWGTPISLPAIFFCRAVSAQGEVFNCQVSPWADSMAGGLCKSQGMEMCQWCKSWVPPNTNLPVQLTWEDVGTGRCHLLNLLGQSRQFFIPQEGKTGSCGLVCHTLCSFCHPLCSKSGGSLRLMTP